MQGKPASGDDLNDDNVPSCGENLAPEHRQAPQGDPVAVAREIALRQLTVRARSRTELERALERRNVPAPATREVLDRLTEVGLIDDEVFARDWLAAGVRRQRSRRALILELSDKGVSREIIDQVVAELDADRDLDVARAFGQRKAAALVRADPAARYRRLASALARRGFSSSIVAQVTREVLDGLDARESEAQEI